MELLTDDVGTRDADESRGQVSNRGASNAREEVPSAVNTVL